MAARPQPGFVSDKCVLRELPDGHWAVIRKQITLGQTQALREKLWAAGVAPGMTYDTLTTAQQWAAWDQDWVERVALHVKEWSLQDEDGNDLPVSVEGLQSLDNDLYGVLLTAVIAVRSGVTEDAKRDGEGADPDAERVAEGDGDQSERPAAIISGGAKDRRVVADNGVALPV